MKHYDIAIVGGGPAGIATALFAVAADSGLADRIVVLEKARYPRDKFCGGAVAARADDLLATIGVKVDVPSVHVRGFSFVSRHGKVCQRLDLGIGRVIRRMEFDQALAMVARARGISIIEDAAVQSATVDSQGVTLTAANATIRAKVAVGADGVGGIMRRSLGLGAGRLRAQVIELDTEPVPGDPERDLLHFDIADPDFTGYAWDFPTVVNGRELVCRGVYHLKYDDRPQDIVARLQRRLRERGLDLRDYRIKRFAERGFEPRSPCAAPRVLLVGEAAGIDAVTGEGIAQAIQYGAVAGPYVSAKLRTQDFSFSDWDRRLAKAKVGVDLTIRHALLPYYYGEKRRWFEPHFTTRPEFVASSLAEFAGQPTSNLRMAKGALAGVWNLMLGSLRGRGPHSEADTN